jgi:hypothetical protein
VEEAGHHAVRRLPTGDLVSEVPRGCTMLLDKRTVVIDGVNVTCGAEVG